MNSNTTKPDAALFYPALTPFKFKGNIVKPPALVQMSADEVAPYLAAQVIGVDAALLPEHDLAFIDAERIEAEAEAERISLEAQRIEDERLEAEATAVDVKTTTPDTTPPTVAAKPAAGVPVAGKTTKPKSGK